MSGEQALVKRWVCPVCGESCAQWTAFCAKCNDYRTFAIQDVPAATFPKLVAVPPEPSAEDEAPRAVSLADYEAEEHERDLTGIAALDAVLGGGLVVDSVVVIAAAPGSGKSTLALQVLSGLGHRAVYASSEETVEQIAVTAKRIGAATKKIFPIAERDIDAVFAHARKVRARTVVVDSLQKMVASDLDSRVGSPAQVKEVVARIYEFAHDTHTAFLVISQVTNEDRVVGGRTVEHESDVLLELEVTSAEDRLLKPIKNRFGATNVVGRLKMTAAGLVCADGDGWDQPL